MKTGPDAIKVKNSGFIHLPQVFDGIDGTLTVAEHRNHIPFPIKRVYYIYGLENPNAVRGKHAHKKLEQVLFCIHGSCEIGLDDGTTRQRIILDKPNTGIYLGVRLWHTMENFSSDCILLVLASEIYRENDYIRDYDEFLTFLKDI
ncbi:FdtA/QdtA family cupin domain-containing protein [candidate division CSSED10-310 bacterium]|uniref:FdtA/QdtA family cupin domain-containing protein n=1 Tax=candidate division CSSED10-310 bacterium TaxID=2855610 RepID=A0ABV6YYS4_UNCC1